MKYVLVLLMIVSQSVFAQVMGGAGCPTMEQQQAAYNQKMASGIVVVNTASQQLQCHYQQLATYWNQVHKDNQQRAKDAQQIAKDIQQIAKDEQQKATDLALAERLAALNLQVEGYDELSAFIEVLMPLLGDCSTSVKDELKRIHYNRSGGGDGTNPGGGGNIRGFDNPHRVKMAQ